ncbi:glycosyltransferase family 2 protein [Candidatus Beckwithbacteria bacterium]|nr:glycosyltransferase family 2 protein [Candidatus Beckwithbacteria bacterium]
MVKFPVTGHMIVKNEERFIWYSLASTAPYLEKTIIFDTGSTDHTIPLIKLFIEKNHDLDISFFQKKALKAKEITKLRQLQLAQTKTPWFLLIDGDEIWPQKQLIKLLKLSKTLAQKTLAVVNQTRNCVGDIWHYLPDSFGKYMLLGKTGHFNIRLMRTKDYLLQGDYPNEGYFINNQNIASQDELLVFSKAWYLHASHLCRTNKRNGNLGRRQEIITKGKRFIKKDIPEVFFEKMPEQIPQVLGKRTIWFELKANFFDILRKI